jgi:hypothetical protein
MTRTYGFGLMVTKKFVFPYGSFSITNGSEIRLWLHEHYSHLYNIIHHKGDMIIRVLETSQRNMAFGRDVIGLKLAS